MSAEGRGDGGAMRRAIEARMRSWDGTELFYRHWPAPVPSDKALILLHRGHEHSGRFQELVDRLGLPDVDVFAWDARGHGRSSGARGRAPSFHALVKDLDCFARWVADRHGCPPHDTAVLAVSMGAVVAAAWAHDYAPPLRGMVLATPAFRIRLYIPFARLLLRALVACKPDAVVRSYVGAGLLTHDRDQADAYRRDPLITRQIAANVLRDLDDAARRLIADAGAITLPTFVLSGASDRVVDLRAQRRFFARLGSPVKEMAVHDGFHHDVFHERGRDVPIARAAAFLRRAFDEPAAQPPPIDADKEGCTKAEYDRLRRPLSPWSLDGLRFALVRLVMRSVGRLSHGVRVGWRSGFDSGPMLDYVYEDRARGLTPLGRWLDRLYLDTPGWRAIRRRKLNLEALIEATIREHFNDRPVRLVDIAAGPGRYLLDLLRRNADRDIAAELRDRDPGGLAAGRALAARLGVANARYVEGDAFDPASLAAIAPRPDIAIVSGLYELFAENEPVLRSLRGLAAVLSDGGFLVYTNQPWHPQLETIARVLVNREGQPWIMRRRTQAEMDALVRAAGFEKLRTETDPDGIFTVSLARKG